MVPGYPRIKDIKTVFLPRQSLLETLGPCFSKSVEEVLAALRPIKGEYQDMLFNDSDYSDEGVDVDKAFDVYESFHHLTRGFSWGKILWPCTCTDSHRNCACKHGGL